MSETPPHPPSRSPRRRTRPKRTTSRTTNILLGILCILSLFEAVIQGYRFGTTVPGVSVYSEMQERNFASNRVWMEIYRGRYDFALKLIETYREEYPGDYNFLFIRAMVLHRQGSVNEATSLLLEIQQKEPMWYDKVQEVLKGMNAESSSPETGTTVPTAASANGQPHRNLFVDKDF